MRLLARCHRCGGPLPFSTPVADRAELSRIRGNPIELTAGKQYLKEHRDVIRVAPLREVILHPDVH